MFQWCQTDAKKTNAVLVSFRRSIVSKTYEVIIPHIGRTTHEVQFRVSHFLKDVVKLKRIQSKKDDSET